MDELSISAAAAEAPSADCLVVDGNTWTFSALSERVGSAIQALRAAGVEDGDRVALAPRADLDSIVWLYALFELGCPAVLIHPRLTEREQTAILDAASPAHVIRALSPEAAVPLRSSRPIPADRTLAVVYTSGTGRAPRGAMLSRRAFVASEAAHAANLGWHPDDRWLLGMPPAHVGGLSILTRCLIARRCVVLKEGPLDAADTLEIMERDGVTLLSVVPTMLRRLLANEDPFWRPSRALRAVLVGGAAFPDALRRQAASRGIPVLATYGCTEACSQVATQSPTQSGQPGSGAPLPGIEVRIENDEIQIRGDTLMDGYLGADHSAEPWTEDGWLRTGDAGAFAADGQLVVRGRIDDLIVSGGENVAPEEVEAWLCGTPGIVEACVFAVDDDEWGQRVAAALVVETPSYDLGGLRALMMRELAPYKRPKEVAILEGLPVNRTGKVDRAQVSRLCQGRLRPP